MRSIASIAAHFGKNPRKGGKPPRDKIIVRVCQEGLVSSFRKLVELIKVFVELSCIDVIIEIEINI